MRWFFIRYHDRDYAVAEGGRWVDVSPPPPEPEPNPCAHVCPRCLRCDFCCECDDPR